MDPIESYQQLARYNTWMNRRLYERCAEGLTDAQRKEDRGAFFRSIHGTLNHILLADRIWLARLTGNRERYASRDAQGDIIPIRALGQELYADFDELRRQREQTDADIESWVAALEPAALDRVLEYETGKAKLRRHPMAWAVTHLFNHQTHHRGQITTLMSQLGVDPGVTDLIAMLREGQ